MKHFNISRSLAGISFLERCRDWPASYDRDDTLMRYSQASGALRRPEEASLRRNKSEVTSAENPLIGFGPSAPGVLRGLNVRNHPCISTRSTYPPTIQRNAVGL